MLTLAVFAVAVGAVVAGFWIAPLIATAAAIAALVCGGGNVVNDIFDYEIDRVNRPKRPLPSGKISLKAAKIYAAALLIVAVALAAIFLNIAQLTLALLNIGVAFIYSSRLKAAPLLGNLCPSWLAASAFLFGALFIGISATILLLFAMAFLANTGREIAKAIEDMPGDTKAKYRTLPAIAGKNFAASVAIGFIVLAVALSPLPWAFGLLTTNYLYVVLIADILFAVACYMLLLSARKGQLVMKIAMFAAIIAFLVGIF